MKFIIIFAFIIPSGILSSQKFTFKLGLKGSYTISDGNLDITSEPDYFPTIGIENPSSTELVELKEIGWIQPKNYAGLEPSIELQYFLGPKIDIGINFSFRKRSTIYDVNLPLLDGVVVHLHRFDLTNNFLGTHLLINYKLPISDLEIGLIGGINYPIMVDNSTGGMYITNFNQFQILETVLSDSPQSNFSEKAGNRYAGLSLTKNIKGKFDISLSLEKRFNNFFGSRVQINDNTSSAPIYRAVVIGNDLTVGLKLCYSIPVKNKR